MNFLFFSVHFCAYVCVYALVIPMDIFYGFADVKWFFYFILSTINNCGILHYFNVHCNVSHTAHLDWNRWRKRRRTTTTKNSDFNRISENCILKRFVICRRTMIHAISIIMETYTKSKRKIKKLELNINISYIARDYLTKMYSS